MSRRGLLKGLAASAIVVGFDPTSRSWVTEASAAGPFNGLPALSGSITTDPATTAAYADDWGHMVHRTPLAVLLPGSVADVVKVVQFARAHGIKVVSRGSGHTPFGQSQVDAGIVIDVKTLDQIHHISKRSADVDAGVLWRDLVLATTAVGRTPPVLTEFLNLTVGGTLSVGGVNGQSYLRGAEVDNVIELQVVTGEGELVKCSRNQNAKLFEVALGGMGLCAIIVRAKIRLVPAEDLARTHRVFYADIPTLLADLRYLANEQRFDNLVANGLPTPSGWAWFIEGTSFYSLGASNDDDDDDDEDGDEDGGNCGAIGLPAHPFLGLNHLPGSEQIEERTYFEFTDKVDQLVDLLTSLGLGGLPHPWLDLFIPDSKINAFATQAVAQLDPSTFLPGSVLIFFVFKKANHKKSMLRLPDEPTFFLFDILQAAPPVPGVVNAVLARNRGLYDQAVALGGAQYVISAVDMTPADWQQHFQSVWSDLVAAKAAYDPGNVLGSGVEVFPT